MIVQMVPARKQTWLFVALAAAVYAAVVFAARTHTLAAHAGAIGLGAACDLTLTVPALYYFLLVRPGHSSPMALVAVALAGARAAGFLLSGPQQAYLPPLRWLGVPLELWVVFNVARGRRRGWVTELFAAEATVFYYALFAWRARPQSAPGSRSFRLAQASGYGMFSILLMTGIVVEGVPMHLLIRRYSHAGAWIFTGLGIYSFLWALALYRSLALRPVLIGSETLILQAGFLWRAEVRRDQIREVRRFAAADAAEGRAAGCLSLVVINEPQWVIELKEPVIACGPFGRRKAVTRIAIALDDADPFELAGRHRR